MHPVAHDRRFSLVRTMSITTAVCLWMFWLCTYMSQLNPIIGPELKVANVYLTA